VLDVEDEEAVVVRLFGLQTHREAACRGVGLGVWSHGGVDAENGRALRRVGEILGVV
jgi:hypothetical protein